MAALEEGYVNSAYAIEIPAISIRRSGSLKYNQALAYQRKISAGEGKARRRSSASGVYQLMWWHVAAGLGLSGYPSAAYESGEKTAVSACYSSASWLA